MGEYKTVHGFGDVNFTHAGTGSTGFGYLSNRGIIEVVPDIIIKRTPPPEKKRIIILNGYDAVVTTHLKNALEDDYLKFELLMNMIHNSYVSNIPVIIYPRYDPTSQFIIGIGCFLTSKISFGDIALFEAGQEITLTWEPQLLLQGIPWAINQVAPDDILLEDDNTMITEDNKQINKE
jgi:hypothetical protein